MASKGPKSIASRRNAKPLGAGSDAATESPPVPFVAHPAPAKAVSKPPRAAAAAVPPKAAAIPVAADPAVSVATAVPVVPAVAAIPVVPTPEIEAEKMVEPVAAAQPNAAAPDSAPPVTHQTSNPTPNPTLAIARATAITQKDISTMDATINTAAETAQAQAKTAFADVNDRAKTAMEKGSKMIAEMSEFSKGNLEAVVESSKIAAKGAEDIARYTSDYVRSTVEKASTTASQFASIKSPTDFFKLHSEMTKQAMDSMMAETAKFTEGYVKLLGEIAQPISNRVAVAVEKVKVAA